MELFRISDPGMSALVVKRRAIICVSQLEGSHEFLIGEQIILKSKTETPLAIHPYVSLQRLTYNRWPDKTVYLLTIWIKKQ